VSTCKPSETISAQASERYSQATRNNVAAFWTNSSRPVSSQACHCLVTGKRSTALPRRRFAGPGTDLHR